MCRDRRYTYIHMQVVDEGKFDWIIISQSEESMSGMIALENCVGGLWRMLSLFGM